MNSIPHTHFTDFHANKCGTIRRGGYPTTQRLSVMMGRKQNLRAI